MHRASEPLSPGSWIVHHAFMGKLPDGNALRNQTLLRNCTCASRLSARDAINQQAGAPRRRLRRVNPDFDFPRVVDQPWALWAGIHAYVYAHECPGAITTPSPWPPQGLIPT